MNAYHMYKISYKSFSIAIIISIVGTHKIYKLPVLTDQI